MNDLTDKPKHLEVRVDGDRVLVHTPVPIECGGCKRVAFFFVNAGGATLCTECDRKK